MDRRSFGKGLVAGLAITTSGTTLSAFASVLGINDDSIDCFSCSSFQSLLGHNYALKGQPAVKLKIHRIESAVKSSPDQQFYVLFEKSLKVELPEGIYELTSPLGKPLTLMLSPSHSDPGIMEAVFNLQSPA